ncbi:unnamed protein product [Notodromas monacha]|uniref:Uncharacterized protein n=1 Tax=Notodromas monacha TaxID=399045 RepID=A0A7R9C0E2_9CRUS|nr:unnamed protein product [Notodromas monacha]CAG0923677.1 unnamed protein product [Notodromas monacha]
MRSYRLTKQASDLMMTMIVAMVLALLSVIAVVVAVASAFPADPVDQLQQQQAPDAGNSPLQLKPEEYDGNVKQVAGDQGVDLKGLAGAEHRYRGFGGGYGGYGGYGGGFGGGYGGYGGYGGGYGGYRRGGFGVDLEAAAVLVITVISMILVKPFDHLTTEESKLIPNGQENLVILIRVLPISNLIMKFWIATIGLLLIAAVCSAVAWPTAQEAAASGEAADPAASEAPPAEGAPDVEERHFFGRRRYGGGYGGYGGGFRRPYGGGTVQ